MGPKLFDFILFNYIIGHIFFNGKILKKLMTWDVHVFKISPIITILFSRSATCGVFKKNVKNIFYIYIYLHINNHNNLV